MRKAGIPAYPWYPAGLYLLGVLHWLLFLGRADPAGRGYDWPGSAYFYGVLREAVAGHTVPYHVTVAINGSTRFLANPGPPLVPHALLLPFLSTHSFVVLDCLILYTIGFAGSFMLKRAAGWSGTTFAVFFLLFNFNGFVTAHLAVGHPWTGYFLLPWFMLLALGWIRRGPDLPVAVAVAVILFAVTMQGFFHLALWCIAFLALASVRSRRAVRFAAIAAGCWILLAAVRILPAALEFAGTDRLFWGGYRSGTELLAALVAVRDPGRPYFPAGIVGEAFRLGWWEYDMYLGWAGTAFVLYFGVWLRLGGGRAMNRLRFPELDLPILVLAVLSLGSAYEFLYRLPLLASERATSRLLILPLVALITVGCARLDHWLGTGRKPRIKMMVTAVGVVLIAAGLAVHSWRWAVPNLPVTFLPEGTVFPAALAVRPDPVYKTVVAIGAAVTIVALTVALAFLYRNRRGLRTRLSRI